jgi:solute:Na+ symporter, SSS family
LLFNGLLKVPMQFLILMVGVMVFVFYQFNPPPLFFNETELARLERTPHAAELHRLEADHRLAFAQQRDAVEELSGALRGDDPAAIDAAKTSARAAAARTQDLRRQTRALITGSLPRPEPNDADYVFLTFVMANLPRGLIGLLLAVILCAAMSSTAGELTALGGCTVVDFYRRSWRPNQSDAHYLRVAKICTGGWGVLAVIFAASAALLDNLIQAVNLLGSLFYGTILGIFLVAFFLRRVRATPVFVAALLSEGLVVLVWRATNIGFLWFNLIGCAAVVALSLALDAAHLAAPSPLSGDPP